MMILILLIIIDNSEKPYKFENEFQVFLQLFLLGEPDAGCYFTTSPLCITNHVYVDFVIIYHQVDSHQTVLCLNTHLSGNTIQIFYRLWLANR